jgi:hypothetical protein
MGENNRSMSRPDNYTSRVQQVCAPLRLFRPVLEIAPVTGPTPIDKEGSLYL